MRVDCVDWPFLVEKIICMHGIANGNNVNRTNMLTAEQSLTTSFGYCVKLGCSTSSSVNVRGPINNFRYVVHHHIHLGSLSSPRNFFAVWITVHILSETAVHAHVEGTIKTRVVFAEGTGECPVHWISRYDTKWPILCWCVMATRSRSPHWLYLQIPPCAVLNRRDRFRCKSVQNVSTLIQRRS